MTAFIPRGTRWLEIAAILALFLVIHVSANETGKFILISLISSKRKRICDSSKGSLLILLLFFHFNSDNGTDDTVIPIKCKLQ